MDRLHLDPAPDLRELLELGLEDEPLDAENLVASTVADVSFLMRSHVYS